MQYNNSTHGNQSGSNDLKQTKDFVKFILVSMIISEQLKY